MVKQKRLLSFVVVGALALVGVFGAFVYRSVSAQAPTPTQAAPTTQDGASPALPGTGKGPRGNFQGTNPDQALADALGTTLDKLQAAETTANADALKEAVAKGLLTQAQADQLSANAANGRHFGGFERFGASGIDYNALLAKALGITTDQLKTAQQKVQDDNLAAAVTSGTLTQAQADLIKARQALQGNTKFQDSLKSAYSAALQQAVTDGVITQAQADAILKDQAATGMPGIPGFGPGRGFEGGPGGPGGPGGRGHGFPNGGTNQNTPVNPTPTAPSSSN
jgi:hypothetical protein